MLTEENYKKLEQEVTTLLDGKYDKGLVELALLFACTGVGATDYKTCLNRFMYLVEAWSNLK